MTKQKASYIESRRCVMCNPLLPKGSEIEKKQGFMKDPENDDKWVECRYCNNKGYNTKRGTLSS